MSALVPPFLQQALVCFVQRLQESLCTIAAFVGVVGMLWRGPRTIALRCRTQPYDLLKCRDPITIGFLRFKTVRTKAIPDAVKNTPSLLQHHVKQSLCTLSAHLSRSTLSDSTANCQTPQPSAEIFVLKSKDWLQNVTRHQSWRERDALKRNRPKLYRVNRHIARVSTLCMAEYLT
jgi:hypothetical protein